MKTTMKYLKKLGSSDEGASLTEYGLLMALIAAVCVTAITIFGNAVAGLYVWTAV